MYLHDKKAFEYFNKTLEHDETDVSYEAKHSLGIMYKNGEGVRKNYKKAFELFTKSVDEGEGSEYENLSAALYLLLKVNLKSFKFIFFKKILSLHLRFI